MVTFRRPKGTLDFLPDETSLRKEVQRIVEGVFQSYGFQPIQTPIFEEFALFAHRSGEEIREKMFTFTIEGIEYALRPEGTAPVCRVVASGDLQRFPRPYKVYYICPCFRYERPQAGRYREFTQAGIEVIGSSSPITDAEVMTVAIRVLQVLGIAPYKLKVGNIGVYRDLLAGEGLDYEAQSRLLNNIDRINGIREKCKTIKTRPSLEHDDDEYLKDTIGDLYRLQEEIEYEGEFEIFPTREFNEAGAREWLDKLPIVAQETYRAVWTGKGRLSKELANRLIEIASVRGSKDEVARQAKALVGGTPAEAALNNLYKVLDWLDVFGVKEYEVVLGVARGLDFYTGTVFEIDCPLLGAQKQICGGGRYDRLVSEFGGPDIPATGFGFGFDRLVEAFTKSGRSVDISKADVFVAATSDEMRPHAVKIAEQLRGKDRKVEVDLLDLSLRDQIGYVSRIGCRYAVIVGPDELKSESVTVRDMKSGDQKVIKLAELAQALE